MNDITSRRAFLRAAVAAGATWATADLAQVEHVLAQAAQHAPGGQASAPGALSPAQFAVVDALVSRIIPAVDGRPGAHEAGAARFIDAALATFNIAQKSAYVAGIDDLNRRAAARAGATAGFSTLPPDQQDAIVRDIESTPFFAMARFDAIVGTFALPTYGGNQDYRGWQMLGFEHQPRFRAPFGFYDAEASPRG